jgi:hypothetical protein
VISLEPLITRLHVQNIEHRLFIPILPRVIVHIKRYPIESEVRAVAVRVYLEHRLPDVGVFRNYFLEVMLLTLLSN